MLPLPRSYLFPKVRGHFFRRSLRLTKRVAFENGALQLAWPNRQKSSRAAERAACADDSVRATIQANDWSTRDRFCGRDLAEQQFLRVSYQKGWAALRIHLHVVEFQA